MFALVIGIMLIVVTARLYLIFPQHDAIFIELAQSKRIRYLILLLPVAPIVMSIGSSHLRFVSAFILAFACVALTWYYAHAQYHFFDAKGTARVQAAQRWVSRVEMLAILTGVYLIIHLLFIVFAHLLTA